MQGTILLDYNENTRQVEDEEKQRFLKSLLEEMGVPVQEIWADNALLSAEDKIKLRSFLNTYNVLVIDDFDGGLKIFVDNEMIGEWKKCNYVLKKDLSQLDKKKRLYLEMQVDCWTIFEQQES
jgi:hypothetical protein